MPRETAQRLVDRLSEMLVARRAAPISRGVRLRMIDEIVDELESAQFSARAKVCDEFFGHSPLLEQELAAGARR